MTRKTTNKLLKMVDEGYLSWEVIARAALCWMSENDVAAMSHDNELYTAQDAEMEDWPECEQCGDKTENVQSMTDNTPICLECVNTPLKKLTTQLTTQYGPHRFNGIYTK